jgi:hypothetical protein
MLSDRSSDQYDSTQCRHCGVTLAARLLSCPSCGANQTDPLGFYPPPAASAKARLPAPQSSIKPQLAAPAAWKTAAGVADDQFYAKHDPWRTPNRHRWAWLVGALAALLLAAVWVAGYLVLTPGGAVCRHSGGERGEIRRAQAVRIDTAGAGRVEGGCSEGGRADASRAASRRVKAG